MNKLKLLPAVALLALNLTANKVVQAQAVPCVYDPLVCEQKQDVVSPFSYFLQQSDQLGFKDAPKGVQVTYDGGYNTQFGEFTLAAGTPLKPLNGASKPEVN